MNTRWRPQISQTFCTDCGDCITVCPMGVLAEVKGKAAVVQPSACTYCALCEDVCPTGAIGLPYQISFLTEASASK